MTIDNQQIKATSRDIWDVNFFTITNINIDNDRAGLKVMCDDVSLSEWKNLEDR